jgi:dienelactone hydrolase
MSCCPPGSLGAAPLSTLTPKGKMVDLPPSDGSSRTVMPCYQVGSATPPKRVLVVFPDVFGINSGNTKVVCDVLQEQLGDDTAVWMPDMFRGKPIMGSWGLPDVITNAFMMVSILWACFTNMKDTKLVMDLKEVVGPALPADSTVVCLGFCYGAWVAGTSLTVEGFPAKAGVGIHPAWAIETVYGRKEEDLATKVGKTPFLFMPASNDELKVGNPVVGMLAKARGIEEERVAVEFPDMVHGWVNRGDSTDAKVKEAQDKAVKLACDFVNEHAKV